MAYSFFHIVALQFQIVNDGIISTKDIKAKAIRMTVVTREHSSEQGTI